MLTLEIFTKPVKDIPNKVHKNLSLYKSFWLKYPLQEKRLIQEHPQHIRVQFCEKWSFW